MGQYPPFTISGAVDTNGNLTLPFGARGPLPYRITQTTAELLTGTFATCAARFNGYLITPIVATGGAAGGLPYIWVTSADLYAVVFTGAPPGAIGKALFIYDDGKDS